MSRRSSTTSRSSSRSTTTRWMTFGGPLRGPQRYASSAMSSWDASGRITASGAPGSATGGSGSDGDDDNTGGDGPAVPQGGATDAKPEHALSYRTEVKFDSFDSDSIRFIHSLQPANAPNGQNTPVSFR